MIALLLDIDRYTDIYKSSQIILEYTVVLHRTALFSIKFQYCTLVSTMLLGFYPAYRYLFRGHYFSELLLCVSAFSVNLLAWHLQQLPLWTLKKVIRLNGVEGVVQPSPHVVIHTLWRTVCLVCKFNNVVVISALVLTHFSYFVRLLMQMAYACTDHDSMQRAQASWQFR